MMGFKPLLPEAMYAHIAELNRQFRAAIWPVSAAKTAYFRMKKQSVLQLAERQVISKNGPYVCL